MEGIPYDLKGCLVFNDPGISATDINKVLAVVEGERDGSDWYWALELLSGKKGVLVGSCDYTGWD